MLDLAIVIVNYNTKDLLRACLRSVYASEGDFSYHVTVVDNASQDGSLDMVRAEFPQARAIAAPVNGGFAYANNIGLRTYGFGQNRPLEALPRYALLLNPDTEVPPTALAEMLALMDARPELGASGPRLILPDGRLDKACRRAFPSPMSFVYRGLGLSKLFPTQAVSSSSSFREKSEGAQRPFMIPPRSSTRAKTLKEVPRKRSETSTNSRPKRKSGRSVP
ncbi:MAG TPA: glycosyltransferase family 2 protein [Anaerolineae bacterium]|nr:glycosyltransferase family 2 protein [Anaerolineae bacterium]